MKRINLLRFSILTLSLLVTNFVFSNSIENNHLIDKISGHNIVVATVDGISPTTGHAGTIVTITGTGFTSTSTV